jgi:hypothetical protein
MQERHPAFSSSPEPRRNGAPSDWCAKGNRQAALPALMFERLSFLEGLDVIEDNSEETWKAWDDAVRAGTFRGGRD